MQRLFFKFSIGALIYALIIIIWGAFVRVSGSGDGCGKHWPLCQGYIIPQGEFLLSLQSWIEYFHRLKSGLFGVLVFVMWLWALQIFSKDSHCRKAMHFVLLFTVTEALIGAGLVLFGLVDQDTSTMRVLVGGLHLVNTFALLASLVAICFFSRLDEDLSFVLRNQKSMLLAFGCFGALCVFGHWASLASQLYPAESLMEGLRADFDSSNSFIVRWRIFHPILAFLSLGLVCSWYARLRPAALSISFQSFLGFFVAAILIGIMTWVSLGPIWMKLFHLLTTDILWMMMCFALYQDSTLRPIGMQKIQRKVQIDEKVLSQNACSS